MNYLDNFTNFDVTFIYDDSTHRFKTVNRDILSNGDIITTNAEYFGDFAIYNKDREYLDINYQIHHDKTHSLYFRGCELIDIDKINDFNYTPPYLFSTYDNNIVIFDVEGKVSSEIIYEVK